MEKPPVEATLTWKEELVFTASSGKQRLVIDGDSAEGPTPMQLVALGVAGCMAIDVVEILRKGRHPLRGLDVSFSGTRADTPPRRYTAITLNFIVHGNVPEDAVRRAIELSRVKYCSASNSLRTDIPMTTNYDIRPST